MLDWSIGYLWPKWQTYWWQVASYLQNHLIGNYFLNPVWNQSDLLISIIKWYSEHVAWVIAYSNNLWPYWVAKIWEDITKFTRRTKKWWEQTLKPEELIAIIQVKIQQCLIWKAGIDFNDIQFIYAHPQAANQSRDFLSKTLPRIEIIFTESNWDSVNRALENPNNSVAIWPSFAVNIWQVVIRKGIDNNRNSTTNFALIQNREKDRIIFTDSVGEKKVFWCIIFIKKEDVKTDIIVSSLLLSHGLDISLDRMSNSPNSWEAVKIIEIHSESLESIEYFLRDVREWTSSIEIKILNRWRIIEINWTTPYDTQYLWPSRLFKIWID